MFEIDTLLILIPAMPLLAMLVTAVLGKRVLGKWSHLPAVTAIAISFVASMFLVFQLQDRIDRAAERQNEEKQIGYEQIVTLWTWAGIDDAYRQSPRPDPSPSMDQPATRNFEIAITLRADSLTAIMLAMVTLISLVVAVYSIGYMHGDPGYWRFFTYISLFVFSMTMLVSVSNFVLLYVFWEAVGLCSYLLIGFWFERPAAAAAGKKAFLVNRVGDFGFALGVFLIWTTYGTLNFHDTVVDGNVESVGVLGQTMLQNPTLYAGGGLATAICLLLMLGACGKSAQFPLHVWLPDAMEGPSPVSALIHAATMVTAGVYMVARCAPLFAASADALHVVALIGGFTALLAAIIAVTQTDLKRILAYSTISQLGYMFLGLGAGTLIGITAGMFHLFTHAFFKALLFLAAGSVMHAMGNVIDIRRLGGLRRRLPTTHWTFLFGCLALAGIVPFAGFWSKDLILVAIHEQALSGNARLLYHGLYYAALFTAFLTALYTFRALFVTFYGRERIPAEAGDHAHESPRVMTGPLVVLALCSLVVGAFFEFTHGFSNFLDDAPSVAFLVEEAEPAVVQSGTPLDELEKQTVSHLAVAVLSSMIALAGVALAWLLYGGRSRAPVERLTRIAAGAGVYRLSHNKFYFDEIYQILVVRPMEGLARFSYWADRIVVDGLVDLCGLVPRAVGAALRPLQTGMIQFYAMAMVLGLLVLLGSLLM